MTRRRAAVVQTLADRAGFVSVQELHAWMGEAGIRVGLTTVYRALHGPERECGAPQRRARAASLTVENRRLSLPCRSDEMSSAADPVIAGGEAEAQRSSGRRTTALLARWLEDFCGRFGRRESGSRTGVLRLAGSDDRDEVLTRLVPPCPLTEREARSVMTGYSRELFPHWITVSGTCNTRETVLKRDGTNVVAGSDCYPDSGSWYSPYDGITEYVASDIDIDHVVPLAEAWRSGADSWHHQQARGLRQRPRLPPTDRGHRQRQPVQGRQGPRCLEASAVLLLPHLLQDVDTVPVPLGPVPPVQ